MTSIPDPKRRNEPDRTRLDGIRSVLTFLKEFLLVVGLLIAVILFGREIGEAKIMERVLHWPFLGFVLVIGAAIHFRKELSSRLKSGAITVKWGDKEIEMGELGPHVDHSVEHLQRQIDELSDNLEELSTLVEGAGQSAETARVARSTPPPSSLSDYQWSRVKKALEDPRYYARSIMVLARIARMTENDMKTALQNRDDVAVFRGEVNGHLNNVAQLLPLA